MLYNNLSSYLRNKYGKKIGKICIDGGFGCPNRDGKCGTGGCIYCAERGAGEHIDGTRSIEEQVREALSRGRYEGYIAYFQNFTNTYAPRDMLRERYDSALIDNRIVALAIGTRPDCIDEEIADLIAGYKDRLDMWVELGLQSASDETARIINRGYNTEVYLRAVDILKSRGIPVVAHMIIGLPTEGRWQALETVDLINKSGASGIKIHSIYVMTGTRLADMYRAGEYTPPTLDEYTDIASECVARLRPDMIVHRLTGDCPDGMLVAPEWNADKNRMLDMIREKLSSRGLRQGALYKE